MKVLQLIGQTSSAINICGCDLSGMREQIFDIPTLAELSYNITIHFSLEDDMKKFKWKITSMICCFNKGDLNICQGGRQPQYFVNRRSE